MLPSELGVTITRMNYLEADTTDEIAALFRQMTPAVDVKAAKPEPQNNLDWFLPALVEVSIAATIYEGFLKHVGADIYEKLKHGVVSLYRRIRGRKEA
jgi:hypothetical protein